MKLYLLSTVLLSIASAQRYAEYTTPVPILKQIDRHNEDGSYSYGYEAADGTFKIESKYPNGEVYGKYGYRDDSGALREIEYGASRRGFEPAGNEINVAPPTLTNNYPPPPLGPNEEDDGQYREDPSVYYKNDPYSKSYNQNTQPAYRPSYQQPAYKPSYEPPRYQQPTYSQPRYEEPAYQEPNYNYQEPAYRPPPQPIVRHSFQSSQPKYQPAPAYNNYNNYNNPSSGYNGYNSYPSHPSTNVDYFSGSYSVSY